MIAKAWIVAALAVAAGAGPEAAKPEGDLGRIQGQWVAAVGRRGEFKVTLQIRQRAVAATIAPVVGPKLQAEGEIALDEAASPRSLDWIKFTTADGLDVPEIRAIYRLDGDTLQIRSGGFHDARPVEFRPGDGIWSDVLIFRRDPAPAAEPR